MYYDTPGADGGYNDDPTRQGGPTGIPDPANPGFDTGGYPLPEPGSAPGSIPQQGTAPAPAPPVRTPTPGPATTQGPGQAPPPPPPPPGTDTGGDLGGVGGGVLAPFGAAPPDFPQIAPFKGLDPFVAGTFKPPSIGEAFDDQAYQWQRQQTLDSLNRWGAAKGTLNDSGTGQAFLDLGNNVAQQRLGDVWNRSYQTFRGDEDARFNAWSANEGVAERSYGLNRQTQSIDPFTALYNDWAQKGNWYYQNQGNATNALLGFGNQV